MIYTAILPNRGILKITGKDRCAFLQGLITNDIHKLKRDQAIYAVLLSSQGKFQYDFFMVACPEEEAWFLECDGDRAEALLKRLSLYKLRCDVAIENRGDAFDVFAVWGSEALNVLGLPFQPGVAKIVEGGVLYVDPRLAELGARVIVPKGKAQDFFERFPANLLSGDAYNLHRLKLGIPDGNRDVLVDRGILLECGFDELNAIDWDKGCYMGQELTARTRYRGLVRKRLVPVYIQGDPPDFQSPIFQGGVEVGNMRTAMVECGIAMIRLEALSKPLPFSCGNATLVPHVPGWMRLPSLTDL
jgi:folate-binding protein YgfZ